MWLYDLLVERQEIALAEAAVAAVVDGEGCRSRGRTQQS